MKRVLTILILIGNAFLINGQENIRRSNTYIDTYFHGEKHFSIKEASIINYNEGNSELTLMIDFASLRSGVDSLDEWLLDLTDSKFIFKGYLPPGDLLTLSHHNLKSLEVFGVAEFNGIIHRQGVLISFYEVSMDGMLFSNSGANYYDRIAANIQFSIIPKYFGVDKKPHHLRKKITIAIGRGIINKV
ncbi:MAG: hypothetical protein V4565_14735 [Bacteroidota bacterium]